MRISNSLLLGIVLWMAVLSLILCIASIASADRVLLRAEADNGDHWLRLNAEVDTDNPGVIFNSAAFGTPQDPRYGTSQDTLLDPDNALSRAWQQPFTLVNGLWVTDLDDFTHGNKPGVASQITIAAEGCLHHWSKVGECGPSSVSDGVTWHDMTITSVDGGATVWQIDGEVWQVWDNTEHRVLVVPEPSAIVLLLVGLVLWRGRR